MSQTRRKIVSYLICEILISVATLSSPATTTPAKVLSANGNTIGNSAPSLLDSHGKGNNNIDGDKSAVANGSQTESSQPVISNSNGAPKLLDNGINRELGDSPVDQLTALSVDDDRKSRTGLADNLGNVKEGSIANSAVVNGVQDILDISGRKNGETLSASSPSTTQYIFDNSEQSSSAPTPKLDNSYRRSHLSLHSNLDDLLNIRRQRRALRFKRNTSYEDFLASLLALDDQDEPDSKYSTGGSFPVVVSSEPVGQSPLSQALLQMLQSRYDRDEDGYVDLDRLRQYYYDKSAPLVDLANDAEDYDDVRDADIVQELPSALIVRPYAQRVVPILPYALPDNRYQRIRRAYYKNYRSPLSIYSGLRRKRDRGGDRYYDSDFDAGEWGKIVGDRDGQSGYDDGANEASKIYSLATLLAAETAPDELAQRSKRSPNANIRMM